MKLNLPSVTLAAVDTVEHELTRLALEDTLARADFGAVLVLSNKRLLPWADCVPVEAQSNEEAERLLWYELPKHLRTDHVMLVQWDGWVVRPELWVNEFLDYDYVGAPWWYLDAYNVGNGGFSLRSRRLMDFLMRGGIPYSKPEDNAICRINGVRVRECGYRTPDSGLAAQFSFEHMDVEGLRGHSFGFHGLLNWPRVLGHEELARRVSAMTPYARRAAQWGPMVDRMREYYAYGKDV